MKDRFAKLKEPRKDKIDEESEIIWIEEADTIKIQYASMTNSCTFGKTVFNAMIPLGSIELD